MLTSSIPFCFQILAVAVVAVDPTAGKDFASLTQRVSQLEEAHQKHVYVPWLVAFASRLVAHGLNWCACSELVNKKFERLDQQISALTSMQKRNVSCRAWPRLIDACSDLLAEIGCVYLLSSAKR